MTTLQDLRAISINVDAAPFKIIKLFYKFIFEREGTNQCRRLVRRFGGFLFKDNSDEYKNKLEYIKDNFDITDLQAIAKILRVPDEGTNEVIARYICSALTNLDSLKDDDDEEDDDEEDGVEEDDEQRAEDVQEVLRTEQKKEEINKRRIEAFAVTFRDVEDSIRSFSAQNDYPVDKWISDFEETATLLDWNELQTFIFAKKSLKGLAKLFIQSERGITTWRKLKKALQEEFSSKMNSAQLHRMLEKRKKKRDETVQEYYLIMKEIASRGYVETSALIQYVIDGIPDSNANKIILYGCQDIKEFKNKLEVYSLFKEKIQTTAENYQRSTFQHRMKSEEKYEKVEKEKGDKQPRCFNCGELGHKSTDCKHKSKGTKCSRFGHRAFECKKEKKPENPIDVNNLSSSTGKNKMYKSITIAAVTINALIDTGSQINIISEKIYKKMGSPKLKASNLIFTGFGRNQVQVLGYLQEVIRIENDDFPAEIYVVTDDCMNMDAIVGNETLDQAEVVINKDGIKITKSQEEFQMMNIEAMQHEEITIGETASAIAKEEIEELIKNYHPNKSKEINIQMKIVTIEDKPTYQQPRRLPFSERDIVNNQVDRWIAEGIIEPCSSEYASPVVLVSKKDGSPRICIDYRKMNQLIVKDRYPLPIIEDVLDQLQEAMIFSTLDLRNGFFHVDVEEDSRKYTSFVTSNGQYQFLKVPFGLCNSPAIFQRFINCIFNSLYTQGIVLPYFDDMIIPAKDEQEGIARLKQVLETAKEYGLEFNKKKCQFLKKKIEFLGHVIENGKLSPSPYKIEAVQKFPEPKTTKHLQSFLGLASYFRKFIPQHSIIVKPLSDMLKKDIKFEFREEQRNSFNLIKQKLSEHPVLQIYKQNVETEVHTDASQEGYGAVLLQKSEDSYFHPVYYMSKRTTDAESKYSSYELEVLAVINALKKFRIYLLGMKFKVVTDCAAFQKTMNKKDLTTRVARWALLLEEFDFEVVHRVGTRMPHVDALSRYPIMQINADSIPLKLIKAQEQDDHIRTIKKILETQPYEDYLVKSNVLFKQEIGQDLMVVPRPMQTEIIKRAHDNGHFAVKKTEELVKREFFIPKLKEKIQNVISNCIPCILANNKEGKKEGFLHPLPKGEGPLNTFHVDHIGPMPSTSKKYKHILTVIDDFTKFVWLFPVKSTTTKEVLQALKIIKNIFGNPSKIISDRGTSFTSTEFKEYCQSENIQNCYITTGIPRGNGQVERAHRTIIPMLTKLAINDPNKWYKFVNKVQTALNNSYQRSINRSPFELLTGVKMRTKDDARLQEVIENEAISEFEEQREELRRASKEQILKIQQENRKTYNLRRKKPATYQVDDLVAIKRTQFGSGLKVHKKFLGPYRVTRVKPNERYDVQREGQHEGPYLTSSCAEYMKRWSAPDYNSDNEFEANSY